MDVKEVKRYNNYYHQIVLSQRLVMEQKKQIVMPILENIMNHVTAKDARFCNTADSTGPFYQGNFLWTKTSGEFDYYINLSEMGKWSWAMGEKRYYKLDQTHQSFEDVIEEINNIWFTIIRSEVPLPNPPAGHSFCKYTNKRRMTKMMFQDDIVPGLVCQTFNQLLIEAIRESGYRGNYNILRVAF